MAARLQDTFYSSELNNTFQVIIKDSSYGGGTIDFDAVSLNFTWKGATEERFNRIMTCEVELGIYVNNADVNSFVNDLIGAEEERFTIEINKNSTIYWTGFILPDLITIEDRPRTTGFVFRLVATDGIGRLKDVEYNNAGTAYSGRETILEHLFKVLGKIDLAGYWGAFGTYLRTSVQWWEDAHPASPVSSDNPLNLTRIDHRTFIEIDEDGENVYMSAYDVLDELCKQWGARFFLSGSYYFIQVNQYAETGDVYIHNYRSDQTLNGTSTDPSLAGWDQTWDNISDYADGNADVVGLTPGQFQFYAPLDRVEVAYKHFSMDSLLSGVEWTDSSGPSQTISDVDDNGGVVKLLITGNIFHDVTFSGTFIPGYARFRLSVDIDDGTTQRWLKRDYYFSGSQPHYLTENATWETSQQYIEILVPLQNISDQFSTPFYIETEALPQDGDLTVDFFFQDLRDYQDNEISSGAYTEGWRFTNVYIEALIDGTPEGQYNTTKYQATNTDATTNSEALRLEIINGDGPTGNTFGHLQVYDGSNWSIAGGNWRKGTSGTYDYTFGEMLAREILMGQITPAKKWIGRILGDLEIYSTLVRDSDNFIASGARYDAGRDIWDGQWFVISTNPTPINEETEETFIGDPFGGQEVDPKRPTRDRDELRTRRIRFRKQPSIQGPLTFDDPPSPPGLATTTSDYIPGLTEDEISQGDNLSSVFVEPPAEDDPVFLAGDSVMVIDPTTGRQQRWTTLANKTPGLLQIETVQAANDFPENSFLVPDFEEQQANISYARIKKVGFHLVDYDTEMTTTTFNKFFRAKDDDDDQLYRQRILYMWAHVGQAPSSSSSVTYTLDLIRGTGTPTTVATANINGFGGKVKATPASGEEFFSEDIYRFDLTRTDASGLDANKGLYVEVFYYNKIFTPDDLGGLQLWLRSDSDVTDSGGSVSQWDDQSGNGNDASQGTGAEQPTIVYNAHNGYPGIDFDGSNDNMTVPTSTAPTGSDERTVFAVFTPTDDIGFMAPFGYGSGSNGQAFNIVLNTSSGNEETSFDGFGGRYGTADFTSAIQIIAIKVPAGASNLSDVDMYRNGTSITMTLQSGSDQTLNTSNSTIKIGANHNTASDFDGPIFEVLVYDSALSDGDRKLVERYLSKKYNIPVAF